MTVKIYGIKNCDTMKKAFQWLDRHNIDYDFHDYKKQGVEKSVLAQAIKAHGWDVVINKRGTTWRQLPQNIQDNMNDKNAIAVSMESPSIIKRPLLLHGNETHIGFKEAEYEDIFNK